MPTITDKARAEAEQAEGEEQPEQPTEEPTEEPDAEPVVEPEPHPGEGLEEPSDAMIAELQAACSDHHDHVHAIMGPFVDGFVPCETCNGIGLAYPTPAKPKLNMRHGAAECSVCDGLGELALPTKREQFAVEQCTNCNGKGWVGAGNMPTTGTTQQTIETYPAGDGNQAEQPQPQPPASTDPRVQQLRNEGFIVLEKPGG